MPFGMLCTETEFAALHDHFVKSGVMALVDKDSCRREDHIGALLADCVLQAGLNYRHVVEPRVKRLKALYPYATRVSIFADLLEDVGAEEVLEWRHPEKPRRLDRMVHALTVHQIETTIDLGHWLVTGTGRDVLALVNGVGPKTLDYMQILCGHPTCAVDRHVVAFMKDAGITPRDYQHAHALFSACAEALRVSPDQLDSAVWRLQSHAPVQLTCGVS